MILSLNENRKLTIINEMFFNIGLVMFNKEVKVFYKTKQLNVKTPERKLKERTKKRSDMMETQY